MSDRTIHRLFTGHAARRALAAWLLVATAGCASVVGSTDDTVDVEVPYIGNIAPGTINWFAWPQAREHCAALGLWPQLIDFRGPVATYRYIARD